ncbi:MAG: FAD-dependent oxidoreductase [Planktomarina sp.]|uniref:NAD(P)/FAD-dependent oxidoreductase n=1 Tax=Planktomarina sp. TaxID=2024851 RepID=UPI003261A530|nr:FAD-dependent oxidoreductase [Planktomarina sp.]
MVHVVIAGAGIVGVSSAIWLQRAGHEVTLVDRMDGALRTSYGNAGVLAAGAILPVPVPGLARKLPKMLFSRDEPLFLQWRYLPRLLPFLLKYLSFARADHVAHCARSLSYLLSDSHAQHQSLAKGTGAERFISDEDFCFGYASEASYRADEPGRALRRAHGYEIEELDGAAYAARDPLYRSQFAKVVCYKNSGRISDPGGYLAALVTHFEAEGGTLLAAQIEDIELEDGVYKALITDQGRVAGDHVVLAMGAWSGKMAKKLGIKRLALESERGYHIELHNPSAMPKAPMMVAAGKFVVTPMEGRIRCAGVVEFASTEAPAQDGPLDFIKRQIAALFTELRYDHMSEWMGRRPATTDSLPLIGAARAIGNGHMAFGHQHVGLTAGPKTGRLIADMVSNRPNNADLSAFDPSRYQASS